MTDFIPEILISQILPVFFLRDLRVLRGEILFSWERWSQDGRAERGSRQVDDLEPEAVDDQDGQGRQAGGAAGGDGDGVGVAVGRGPQALVAGEQGGGGAE